MFGSRERAWLIAVGVVWTILYWAFPNSEIARYATLVVSIIWVMLLVAFVGIQLQRRKARQ